MMDSPFYLNNRGYNLQADYTHKQQSLNPGALQPEPLLEKVKANLRKIARHRGRREN